MAPYQAGINQQKAKKKKKHNDQPVGNNQAMVQVHSIAVLLCSNLLHQSAL